MLKVTVVMNDLAVHENSAQFSSPFAALHVCVHMCVTGLAAIAFQEMYVTQTDIVSFSHSLSVCPSHPVPLCLLLFSCCLALSVCVLTSCVRNTTDSRGMCPIRERERKRGGKGEGERHR